VTVRALHGRVRSKPGVILMIRSFAFLTAAAALVLLAHPGSALADAAVDLPEPASALALATGLGAIFVAKKLRGPKK
jgi:hypothetical protein